MQTMSGQPVTLQIFEWVKEHGGEPIIPFSGALESKLFDMPDDEKAAYLKEVRSRMMRSVRVAFAVRFTGLQTCRVQSCSA